MIFESVVAFLKSNNITIFPSTLPEKVEEGITYELISEIEESTHQGRCGASEETYQFNFWADRHVRSSQLYLSVDNLFKAFKGNMSGTNIAWIEKISLRSVHDKEANKYGIQVEYKFYVN